MAIKESRASTSHRNTIRNTDWLDSCLQVSYKTFFHLANKTSTNWYQTVKYDEDTEIGSWSSNST
jgi:hypothetical protein